MLVYQDVGHMMPMYIWFFRTCRMRLDDAVGDLLTSWVRIQVCFGQILSKSWS